jgi:hypothetical protein
MQITLKWKGNEDNEEEEAEFVISVLHIRGLYGRQKTFVTELHYYLA